MRFVAHKRDVDNKEQSVAMHLSEVGDFTSQFSAKICSEINSGEAGALIGLLHDFGKYSQTFQRYIQSATGMIKPDEGDYVDAKGLKGKIDHSTAGAQWIFDQLGSLARQRFTDKDEVKLVLAGIQTLALCVASHHSGLIDCLPTALSKGFSQRIRKPDDKTFLKECTTNADSSVVAKANVLASNKLLDALLAVGKKITQPLQNGFLVSELSRAFYAGLYTKFLFSGLIDADRISSADFENPQNRAHRSSLRSERPNWTLACERVEDFIAGLETATSVNSPIDGIRQTISNQCKKGATDQQGIYSLTVPTGGGKTYASLRYAVHHAQQHQLDRIIYIIPFTSIIDQNASAIRKVLEPDGEQGQWVFEHHSNLEPEQQTWRSKLVAENWDAPIVLTTMVQFLETLLSGGTRGVRRLHQLANSVLVFDEIQTLPINCTHLFCNSINFLKAHCKTTAVLCTATQPLLHQLKQPEKGQLHFDDELMPDVAQLFDELKRVDIVDSTKTGGWSVDEISQLAMDEFERKTSCLVIVNTKKWAQVLYQACVAQGVDEASVFHLSTSQCPAHRKRLLDDIRQRLDNKLPILCFSTQLIEAGVDVDFAAVIRFLAGLDSIAQAAGRCNRNGHSDTATVTVVNPDSETIDMLEDIKVGICHSRRIFEQFKGQDLLAPEVMRQYFDYYFFERANDMSYPLTGKTAERDDNLLNLLSLNSLHQLKASPLPLKQSFMTAGKAFKAIDAPTQAIMVPYGEGKTLITQLCAVSRAFDAEQYYQLIKQLQKFSVNVFPNVWRQLQQAQATIEIIDEHGEGQGVYYLDERYYSEAFGLTTEPTELQQVFVC